VLNEEAVVAALDKQGVPREKIYDEEASAKLSRSGNPVIKKTAEALKSLSSNLVDAFVARCEGKFIPGQDVEFDAIEEKPRKSPRM
jgi:sulfur carrier protein ThiS